MKKYFIIFAIFFLLFFLVEKARAYCPSEEDPEVNECNAEPGCTGGDVCKNGCCVPAPEPTSGGGDDGGGGCSPACGDGQHCNANNHCVDDDDGGGDDDDVGRGVDLPVQPGKPQREDQPVEDAHVVGGAVKGGAFDPYVIHALDGFPCIGALGVGLNKELMGIRG